MITKEIGLKIQQMSLVEGSNLMLMMQDFMYFDTIPDEYKSIIHGVFGCEYPETDEQVNSFETTRGETINEEREKCKCRS